MSENSKRFYNLTFPVLADKANITVVSNALKAYDGYAAFAPQILTVSITPPGQEGAALQDADITGEWIPRDSEEWPSEKVPIDSDIAACCVLEKTFNTDAYIKCTYTRGFGALLVNNTPDNVAMRKEARIFGCLLADYKFEYQDNAGNRELKITLIFHADYVMPTITTDFEIWVM